MALITTTMIFGRDVTSNKIKIQHLPWCRGIPMMSPSGSGQPSTSRSRTCGMCTVVQYSACVQCHKWCSVFASQSHGAHLPSSPRHPHHHHVKYFSQWKYNSEWTIYLLLILVNHYKEICRYVFWEFDN